MYRIVQHIILSILALFSLKVMAEGCPVVRDSFYKSSSINWPHIEKKQVLNASCWLSQLEAKKKQENFILIDVRPTAQNKADPIKGALIIKPYELPDKGFLKDQEVLLIGTGFDQGALDQTCTNLRNKGFNKVFAMKGGIFVWHNQLITEITPEDFLIGSSTYTWKVITLGLPEQEIHKLPEKPFKQLNLTEVGSLNLEDDIKPFSNDLIPYVFIATDDVATKKYQQILATNSLFKDKSVWLQGGFSGYEKYILQQHKIQQDKGRSLSASCK